MWARGPCLRGSHKSVRPWWSLHEGWPPAAAKTMPPFVRWRLATAMEMETSRGELRSRMWMPEASLYLSTLYLSTYVPMYRWGTIEGPAFAMSPSNWLLGVTQALRIRGMGPSMSCPAKMIREGSGDDALLAVGCPPRALAPQSLSL